MNTVLNSALGLVTMISCGALAGCMAPVETADVSESALALEPAEGEEMLPTDSHPEHLVQSGVSNSGERVSLTFDTIDNSSWLVNSGADKLASESAAVVVGSNVTHITQGCPRGNGCISVNNVTGSSYVRMITNAWDAQADNNANLYNVTLAFWMRPITAVGGSPVRRGGGGPGAQVGAGNFGEWFMTFHPKAGNDNLRITHSLGSPIDTTWHHYAWRLYKAPGDANASAALYVDGVFVQQVLNNAGSFYSTYGAGGSWSDFQLAPTGKFELDEVRIYRGVTLSADEIYDLATDCETDLDCGTSFNPCQAMTCNAVRRCELVAAHEGECCTSGSNYNEIFGACHAGSCGEIQKGDVCQ